MDECVYRAPLLLQVHACLVLRLSLLLRLLLLLRDLVQKFLFLHLHLTLEHVDPGVVTIEFVVRQVWVLMDEFKNGAPILTVLIRMLLVEFE